MPKFDENPFTSIEVLLATSTLENLYIHESPQDFK